MAIGGLRRGARGRRGDPQGGRGWGRRLGGRVRLGVCVSWRVSSAARRVAHYLTAGSGGGRPAWVGGCAGGCRGARAGCVQGVGVRGGAAWR